MASPRDAILGAIGQGTEIGAAGAQQAQQRALREKLARLGIASRQQRERRPTEGEQKRALLKKDIQETQAELDRRLKESGAIERGLAGIPYLGSLAGEAQAFLTDDTTIRDIQRGQEQLAQDITFLKSGAQAPETEFQRMKKSSFSSPFASAEEQRRAAQQTLSKLGIAPTVTPEEEDEETEYLRLKQKYGR